MIVYNEDMGIIGHSSIYTDDEMEMDEGKYCKITRIGSVLQEK